MVAQKQVSVGWFANCLKVRKAIEKTEVPGNLIGVLGSSTSVVTGANSGIGKSTAQHLSYLGGTVILACRSLSKAEKAIEEIKASNDCNKFGIKSADLKLIPLTLDLGDLSSVASFADVLSEKIKGGEIPQVRLMVCNAGLLPMQSGTSAQGYEHSFAVNHLGHFFLTKQLLKNADTVFLNSECRFVVLSSTIAHGGPFLTKKVADEATMLELVVAKDAQKQKSGLSVYGNSKLCNVHFAQKLQRMTPEELNGAKITACSLHPGVVRTEVTRGNSAMHFFMKYVIGWGLKSPDQGAATSLYTSLMPDEAVAGLYFADCAPAKEGSLCSGAKGEEASDVLWKISEDLCEKFLQEKGE